MLPDNLHFFAYYYDWDDLYELELHDQDNHINTFDYSASRMDIKKVDQKDLMYFRSGKYTNKSYLFEVDLLNTVSNESDNPFNINYANNQISILLEEINFSNFGIEIFNLSGLLIFNQENIEESNFKKELELAPGVYICKLTISGKSYTKKFLAGGK
jgi:hypothetical protein